MANFDDKTTQLSDQGELVFRGIEVLVIEGASRGQRAVIPLAGILKVGTSAATGLRLEDPAVSRVHCELRIERSSVRLVDHGSTNGTFVDGLRLRDADVVPGVTVRVGNTAFRILAGDEPVHIPLSLKTSLGGLVGASIEMRRLYAAIERVAPTDATVLVQGETGTGKELVARAIHDHSRRRGGAFVAVDCGAIAPTVIESELFGHARGAFSGAMSDRVGLFEAADGGTLFLDEIGELPLVLQAKLLRALETREIRRVGANTTRKIDVRLIAATNRPLAQSVNEGTFREELYYRLAVVEMRLPALHARRDDLPILANHFYASFSNSDREAPPELVSALLTRSWPGNVRELRNFIERCVTLGMPDAGSREGASAPSLRPVVTGLDALVPVGLPMKEAKRAWLDQFESAYVRAVLAGAGGNVTRAAEAAGISRRFMQRLMIRLGFRLEPGTEGDDGDGGDDGDDSDDSDLRT